MDDMDYMDEMDINGHKACPFRPCRPKKESTCVVYAYPYIHIRI